MVSYALHCVLSSDNYLICLIAIFLIITTAILQWLVEAMDPTGPFALGQELGLVDCAVGPFLLRLCVLEHYR